MNRTDDWSIKAIQSTCPKWCDDDRITLERLFNSGKLFPDIRGASRIEIWRAICSIDSQIPTLYTFFEDVKYLTLCHRVLSRFVCSPEQRCLRTVLHQFFVPPEVIPLELSEGRYEDGPLNLSQNEKFQVGYHQIWLFAMRHWWQMTEAKPRKDRSKEDGGMDLQCQPDREDLWIRLAALFRRLGFNCPSFLDVRDVANAPSGWDASSVEALTDELHISQSRAKRCGIPFEGDVEADQRSCFLPAMLRINLNSKKYCTRFFGRQTFYFLFFDRKQELLSTTSTFNASSNSRDSAPADRVIHSPSTPYTDSATAVVLYGYTSENPSVEQLAIQPMRPIIGTSLGGRPATVHAGALLPPSTEDVTVVWIENDKTRERQIHTFTRETAGQIIEEMALSGTSRSFFLADGLGAVGPEDLVEALEATSQRRVYYVSPLQRDKLAQTMGLGPSN
jgi:Protein of unknown function (DUF3723)